MSRRWSLPGVLLLALLIGCGELPTADRGATALRILPVFKQVQGGLPILAVDELRVRAFDLAGSTLVGEVSVPVAPNDVEVEVELSVDAAADGAVVIEVELRENSRPVYFGGPIAAVPGEAPIEVPVGYVGAAACGEWVPAPGVGPIGGEPAVARGRLEVGDCYRSAEVSFADRWRVDVASDAGLTIAVDPVDSDQPLYLRVTHLDGSPLMAPARGGAALPVAAGSYIAEVTSTEPLARLAYELSIAEYDRCDVEVGQLADQTTRSGTLVSVDCPLPGERVTHLWGMEVAFDGPYRIDLESGLLDMELLVTPAEATDPFAVEPILQDRGRGEGPFGALVAGVLPTGRYRVWSATATPIESFADYQIAMQRLTPGAPRAEVRQVQALGTGSGQCGSSHAFVFRFGFEDGDGDLVEGGGVTIRLTSIPSGIVEVKGVGWESFNDLNPFAGYASVTTCEAFLGGDTAKQAEFFLTDAEGRTSATISQLLRPGAAGVPRGAPTAPVVRPLAPPSRGGRNR